MDVNATRLLCTLFRMRHLPLSITLPHLHLHLLLVLLLLLLLVKSVTHIIMALVLRRHASNMPQLALLALMPLATLLLHPCLALPRPPRACFLCLVPQTALDFHMNEPRRAEPGYLFVCLSWSLIPSIPIPIHPSCCSCCVCLID